VTFGSAQRPLQDSLPSMVSTRGELVWNGAPPIEDLVVDGSNAAINVITSAQDAVATLKNAANSEDSGRRG